MKGKVILFSSLALLMLFAAAAPVMACNPKPRFSFTQGEWAIANPSVPGTTITKNNIEIVIGAGYIDYRYSSMFGYSVSDETFLVDTINLVTLTGWGFGTATCTAKGSTRIEQYAWKLNGLGPYTYEGPTFTALGTTYHTGDSFYGVLTEGSGTVEFTSGPYAGETGVFTFAGCYPTAGAGISYWTYYVH